MTASYLKAYKVSEGNFQELVHQVKSFNISITVKTFYTMTRVMIFLYILW